MCALHALKTRPILIKFGVKVTVHVGLHLGYFYPTPLKEANVYTAISDVQNIIPAK